MDQQFQGQQKLLLSMGFTDFQANHEALLACGGQFQQAVAYLTNPEERQEIAAQAQKSSTAYKITEKYKNPASDLDRFPPLDRDQSQKVAQVCQLGFTDQGKIRHALELSGWNVESAVTMLLDEDAQLDSNFSAQEATYPSKSKSPIKHNYAQEKITPQIHDLNNAGHKDGTYLFPKLSHDRVQKVIQVANQGFHDEGKIRHALELSSWDVYRAVQILRMNNETLRSDYSAINAHSNPIISVEQDTYSIFRQVNPRDVSVFDKTESPE